MESGTGKWLRVRRSQWVRGSVSSGVPHSRAGNPVMAPDGRVVAYLVQGLRLAPQRHVGLGAASGSHRGRKTEFEPSSFSPDGSKLAGTVGWLGQAVRLPSTSVTATSRCWRGKRRNLSIHPTDRKWPSSAGRTGGRARSTMARRRSTSCGLPGSAPSPDPGSCGAVTSCLQAQLGSVRTAPRVHPHPRRRKRLHGPEKGRCAHGDQRRRYLTEEGLLRSGNDALRLCMAARAGREAGPISC